MNTIKTSKKSFFTSKISLLYVLSFSMVNFSFAEKIDQEKTELAFVGPFKKTGSITYIKEKKVTFLKDKKGKKFVLKHHRGSEYAIHETIATKIGMSVEIPINQVEIFGPDSQHTKDYSNKQITTLHTHVQGREIQDISDMDNEINIYRGMEKINNLKSMTKNRDLCDIVALDIFVNNPDRHNDNFFVEQQSIEYPEYTIDIEQNGGNIFADQAGKIVSERFHAIDMDYSYENIMLFSQTIDNCDRLQLSNEFKERLILSELLPNHLLATQACDFLEELEDKNHKLSSKEIKALKRVNKTLGKLIDAYPAEKLYHEWMAIADKVHYTYCPIKKENIQIALEYNIHEVKRLQAQINAITSTHESVS